MLMFLFGFCLCCFGIEQLLCSEARAPSQDELTSIDSSESANPESLTIPS
jgi:hypothetical protein